MPANTDEVMHIEVVRQELEILKIQIAKLERGLDQAEEHTDNAQALFPRYKSWEIACERLSCFVNAFCKQQRKILKDITK